MNDAIRADVATVLAREVVAVFVEHPASDRSLELALEAVNAWRNRQLPVDEWHSAAMRKLADRVGDADELAAAVAVAIGQLTYPLPHRDGRTCDDCGGVNVAWGHASWRDYIDPGADRGEGFAGLVLCRFCFVERVQRQAGAEAALGVLLDLGRRQQHRARERQTPR